MCTQSALDIRFVIPSVGIVFNVVNWGRVLVMSINTHVERGLIFFTALSRVRYAAACYVRGVYDIGTDIICRR